MTNKTFIVLARKWGDNETHSYIVGCSDFLNKAKYMAEQEANHRGGKYAGVVYELEKNKYRTISKEVFRSESMAG
jgi:hypothetical protein